MIVVAATQAALRNLTNLDLDWANLALEHMEWADSFLQKGTLWLAFFPPRAYRAWIERAAARSATAR